MSAKRVIDDMLSSSTGFLLDSNIAQSKRVIEYAIDWSNREILKDEEFTLSPEIAEVEMGNEFRASQSICAMLRVSKSRRSSEMHDRECEIVPGRCFSDFRS